jgi:hypothetical protein
MHTMLTDSVIDDVTRIMAVQERAVLNHILETVTSKGVCEVRLRDGDHLKIKGVGVVTGLGRMVKRLDEAGHEVRVIVRFLRWPGIYLRVTRKNRRAEAPWPARFKNP